MQVFKYSPSTNGFYLPSIHGENIPADAVDVSAEEHAALLQGQANGKRISAGEQGRPVLVDAPAPSAAQQRALLTQCVQAHIDAPAVDWGYDSAASAVTYVTDPFEKFRKEGMAILDFRSACWKKSGEILADVEAGMRPIPTKAALLAEMPDAPTRPA